MLTVLSPLSTTEADELRSLETAIERGLQTFVEVGNALMTIRDSRLYRAEYRTFEEYCQQRWQLKQSRAYQMIDAAKVVGGLESSTIVELLPTNEAQARPLTRLEPEEQVSVWQEVVQNFAESGITANVVEQAVTRYQQQQQKAEFKAQRRAELDAIKTAVPAELAEATLDDRVVLYCADAIEKMSELPESSVDAIITDPPYPKEYLPLYEGLAIQAARILKPNGSLVVMSGQYYLPEILALMTPHIRYHWLLSYMTPGAIGQQFGREVNTSWKPILWFIKGNKPINWIGDVVKSDYLDKNYHTWGQSESGFAALVEKFSNPGDTVLDPFLGGGTTAVVCYKMNRRFIGIDNVQENLGITQRRLLDG